MVRRGHRLALPQGLEVPPLWRAYLACFELKLLLRQGWLRSGIPASRCESVAEHSFGVALLCLWLAESLAPGLDSAKVLRMAMIHDLGEADVGDLTPGHGVDKSEKSRLERASVQRILAGLPNGEQLLALWEEYEAQSSPEARFVKAVDRLEMAFQATVYEHLEGGDLSEFFASASRQLEATVLDEVFAEVLCQRP